MSKVSEVVLISVIGERAPELVRDLTETGFYATMIASHGGLLDEPGLTLLIGLESAQRGVLLDKLRAECHTRRRLIPAQLGVALAAGQTLPVEAETDGAMIYVFAIERFEQL